MNPPPATHQIRLSVPSIGEAERRAVMEVLDSGMLVQGPRVADLERKFAAVAGTAHAIATSSGTTALHLALLAHGIGPGDEVITSPFTFIASVNAILHAGATPVLADIDPDTFNVDPDRVRAAISSRTRAILPVHLYGLPADMDAIMGIARDHGLAVIEDCAQAVGATHRNRPVGSFGTGCFSLYATKNVMSGEGGMVTTDDDEVAERVRLLRSHGMRTRYEYVDLGYNLRLSDLHAAIGVVQMDRLEDFTTRRRKNAQALSAGIRAVWTPGCPADREHVWHQYTVRLGGLDREAAIQRLTERGVGAGVFYPKPVQAYDHVARVTGPTETPQAAAAAREVISLPVHPELTDQDLQVIVDAVNSL